MREIELVLDEKASLGEGPCWDDRRQLLYWIDVIGQNIHCYDPVKNTNQTIDVGQYIGSLAIRGNGGVIVALHHGFYLLDDTLKKMTLIHDPEEKKPNNRFNDGKCDPVGRFWAGTMELEASGPNGALYCLEPNLTVHKALDQVTISNGICWSPDEKTMYFIDTPTQEIVAFDYKKETGRIDNQRVVFCVPTEDGKPDGMTIDEEGMLWVAYWGGSCVTRLNPNTGKVLFVLSVPVTNVTSCAFGGENMDELFITTARIGLDEERLLKEPHAGGLYKCKTNVKGMPSYLFKG